MGNILNLFKNQEHKIKMRLLEPLQGVKLAQGHWKIHLMFFIAMYIFNPEKGLGHRAFETKPQWMTKKLEESGKKPEGLLRILNEKEKEKKGPVVKDWAAIRDEE